MQPVYGSADFDLTWTKRERVECFSTYGKVGRLNVAVKMSSLMATAVVSLIGKIISMGLALHGFGSKVQEKGITCPVETQTNMGVICYSYATHDASKELWFWTEFLDWFNTHPTWHRHGIAQAAVRCVYSDASDTDY